VKTFRSKSIWKN